MNSSVLRYNFLQRKTEETHEFYVKQRNECVSLEKYLVKQRNECVSLEKD